MELANVTFTSHFKFKQQASTASVKNRVSHFKTHHPLTYHLTDYQFQQAHNQQIMAEPRARVRQKGQVFSSDDRKSTTTTKITPRTYSNTISSIVPPSSLRRPPSTPTRHNQRPRRDSDRLHHRNLPLRRALCLLQPAPKDQIRRLQIRPTTRRGPAGTRAGAVVARAEIERGQQDGGYE